MPNPISKRLRYGVAGIVVLLLAVLMPYGWYDALPTNPEVPPPPIRGTTLLRLVLAIEGLVLALARTGWSFVRVPEQERLAAPRDDQDASGRPLAALLAVTTAGLALRLFNADSDLWLDEVRATMDATTMSTVELFGTYLRSNVHLLNTLGMQLAIAFFGESAWSVRLPAILSGAATVPALYWVSRMAMSRAASLAAALLLAVSYHHIFFSQNARGYVLYLFFSIVATGLLVRGLEDDQPRTWALYIAASLLNFASLLLSGFVFAGHILVGATALVLIQRGGASPLPMLKRLLAVFATTALLGFQLYSVMMPQVYVYIGAEYSKAESGYKLLSTEFVRELGRGLEAGFGPAGSGPAGSPGLLLGAIPFLVAAGLGFLALVRRRWALAVGLTLPLVLSGGLLLVRGLAVSPRFFLLGLPIAVLTAVHAIDGSLRLLAARLGFSDRARQIAFAAIAAVLCLASLTSLRSYYATPKQSYRASLEHITSARRPDEIVIALHTAKRGYQYYGPNYGLTEGEDLFIADTVAELDAILDSHGAGGAWLVTSFPRALHIVHPDLESKIEAGWALDRTFPATIGNGQITAWAPRRQ